MTPPADRRAPQDGDGLHVLLTADRAALEPDWDLAASDAAGRLGVTTLLSAFPSGVTPVGGAMPLLTCCCLLCSLRGGGPNDFRPPEFPSTGGGGGSFGGLPPPLPFFPLILNFVSGLDASDTSRFLSFSSEPKWRVTTPSARVARLANSVSKFLLVCGEEIVQVA